MEKKAIQVLLVEDSEDDALLVREMLEPPEFAVAVCATLADAVSRLRAQPFDAILLDLGLPDSKGLETLRRVRTHASATPVLVLTGLQDDTVALEAVQSGAQDFIVKGEGNPRLLAASIRHGIERQRLRAELEEAQGKELHMKDQLLSHVSHELRTPLAVIYEFSTILLDGLAGDLSPGQRECAEVVLRNANQLRTMIDALLEVTAMGSGQLKIEPRATSLPRIVQETAGGLKLAAAAKRIDLTTELEADLPAALADPDRVAQVLLSLLDNAIKFTPEGGRIVVRAGVEGPNLLRVTVEDTGCGIEGEDEERIFDYLYQGSASVDLPRKGLGLGLYICRQIIHRQGGTIWVESEPGTGSRFSFTVPATTRDVAPFPEVPSAA